MSEAIVVALIAGGASLLGIIITSIISNQQIYAKLDKQSEVSDAKLETEIRVVRTELGSLRDEVRKHNGHGERISSLEEQAKAANRRLTNLEQR